MHGYRAASNQKMLDKVDTFKFEVLFNNWINPKVLAQFTKRVRKSWKRGYGFPFTTGVYWDGHKINTGDASPCWWHCAKLVRKKMIYFSTNLHENELVFLNEHLLPYLNSDYGLKCS